MRRVIRLNIKRLKKLTVFLCSYFGRFWMPVGNRDWYTETIEVSTVFTRVLFFSCLLGSELKSHHFLQRLSDRFCQ